MVDVASVPDRRDVVADAEMDEDHPTSMTMTDSTGVFHTESTFGAVSLEHRWIPWRRADRIDESTGRRRERPSTVRHSRSSNPDGRWSGRASRWFSRISTRLDSDQYEE